MAKQAAKHAGLCKVTGTSVMVQLDKKSQKFTSENQLVVAWAGKNTGGERGRLSWLVSFQRLSWPVP